MPRRWTAEPHATEAGRWKRLEDDLHAQWALWHAARRAADEERATKKRLEKLRRQLTGQQR